MTVSSRPPSPPDNAAPFSEPPALSPSEETNTIAPRPPRRRISLMAALAGFVVVVTLLILLTDAGHTTASTTVKIPPTATAKPSPTATIIPSPTAMPGFKVYTDLPNSFVMQYPTGWTLNPINPNQGVEFDDIANQNSYSVQVFVPGEATTPGSAGNASDPSAWVQYEIGKLATTGTVQQETGPIPAKTIGSQVWQSGIARVSSQDIVFRVDVYATIHNGKPYIINVVGVDDRFTTGSQQFFEPMFGSFQFLLPTP